MNTKVKSLVTKHHWPTFSQWEPAINITNHIEKPSIIKVFTSLLDSIAHHMHTFTIQMNIPKNIVHQTVQLWKMQNDINTVKNSLSPSQGLPSIVKISQSLTDLSNNNNNKIDLFMSAIKALCDNKLNPYLNQSGFTHPIVVTDKEGLGTTAPPPHLNISTVVDALGPDHVLDIIDVMRQKTCQMTAEQFEHHFYYPKSEKILNCLSLEATSTTLSEAITPPLVARKLCWMNNVWPSSNTLTHHKPQVQKHCIMSMKDSFTDFHIDFKGTSVWYHTFSCEKHFFLIRPTPNNLSLYKRWIRLATQSETFLRDMVNKCYILRLKAGQTVFIPTGWIHAIYTPANSVVFKGNFFHSLYIQPQLNIYKLEGRLKNPPNYRFPSFEVVHWLAARKLKKNLADLNSDITGISILTNHVQILIWNFIKIIKFLSLANNNLSVDKINQFIHQTDNVKLRALIKTKRLLIKLNQTYFQLKNKFYIIFINYNPANKIFFNYDYITYDIYKNIYNKLSKPTLIRDILLLDNSNANT